ncbi:MAG TPA: amidohydrolase family protein [Acidimicrobiia bacterium]|nr:amidohydrolase family protein [Acidimicrobiia bacterium]
MLDVLISDGVVVDGTGAPARRADVGIVGDRIVQIGAIDVDAVRTIDASDKVVTPGFVDVHTHFDAQVFWDGALTPSPLHGVTTAFAGNCGFTIAPLLGDANDADYLMRMLARVEGMPLQSLRQGVPWNWASTAEYLDAIDGTLGINAGFMVGHSAIRRSVMRGDANRRAARPDEIDAMCDLLRAGLEAGGVGFSSSYARTHNDADGHMVPSRYATAEELVALSRVTGEFEGTSIEFIPMNGTRFEPWAVDLIATMSAAAQRALNWNIMHVNATSLDDNYQKLAASDVARERGGRVVALTIPMVVPTIISFRSGFLLDAMPGWSDAMLLPPDEKLRVLQDRDARARLRDGAADPANPMHLHAHWDQHVILDVVAPENEQYRGLRVGEIASDDGRDPFDVLCDIAVADELNTSFGYAQRREDDADWAARLEIWRDGRAVIGASDAGAHVDLLASFNYPTMLLGEAVRDRGLLPIEEAVHLITDVPARLYGLRDRGRLAEGAFADVVVLDAATVASDALRTRFDLPGDAGRLFAGAHGIEHVLVNGRAIVRDGELTGERSGTLVRSGLHTETPALDD